MNHINNNNNSNNNNSSNNNNHEILFWKVFKNIYLRDIILSSIHNNNKSKCHNSYYSTSSLQLMFDNNKYNIIIDKLKSNHYIHFNYIPDLYNSLIPYNKAKEIHQLLLNQYKDHFKRIDSSHSHHHHFYIENYKLLYSQNQYNNNYNHYKAYGLYFYYMTLNNSNNQYSKVINYFKQIMDNSNNDKEYNHINKKQKTSTNNSSSSSSSGSLSNNNNNSIQDYIQKLISTSSSSSSSSPTSTSTLSIKNEIIESIYNNKPIPINLNQYYSSDKNNIYYYNSNQELIKKDLKIDIESILINLNGSIELYDSDNSQELLELVLLKLLYHHDSNINIWYYSRGGNKNLYEKAPVNSLIHAKIYSLNQINKRLIEAKEGSELLLLSSPSYLQFKQHLIGNQVNTLNELISVASNTFIDKNKDIEDEMNRYFGIYYNYYKSTKPIQVDQPLESNITPMIFTQSIINQSDEAIKQISKLDLRQLTYKIKYSKIKYINSVGNGFGSSNQDESIKERSTTYFNLLIKTIDELLEQGYNRIKFKKDIWLRIFKIIIYNYNAKLFEWLLESNKQLKDIYYELLDDNNDYHYKLFSAHIRINKESNQINYDMFNVFIKHTQCDGIDIKSIIEKVNKKPHSHQIYSLILNHLISSLPSSSSSSSNIDYEYIGRLFYNILLSGFHRTSLVDEYIQIYNQINSNPSLNQFIAKVKEELLDCNNLLSITNPTTMLISVLIKSINRLDFESINKIISAVLNNSRDNSSSSNNNSSSDSNNNRININIPTTIDNSLDLIKYLFNNQYLKEFNIITLAFEIRWHVQEVDKEFIMELVQNYSGDQKEIEEIKKSYYDMEQVEQAEKVRQVKRDAQFSLYNLEKLKYELNNNINTNEINNIEQKEDNDNGEQQQQQQKKKDEILSNEIIEYYLNGYYDMVYQFLNNNKQFNFIIPSDEGSTILDHLESNHISIEWFTKLYPLFFIRLIESDSYFIRLIISGPQIFEFIWDNHFNDDQQRFKYILELIHDWKTLRDIQYHQIIEYILKSKREFIISSTMYSSLTTDQIYQLHYNSLLCGSLSTYKQIRSIFPSYQFKINFTIIKQLISYFCRYDAIEYLYENNLIPNLDQIIGTDNLNKLLFKEYKCYYYYQNDYTIVPISMFILIHTIIKLQRQQQQHNTIINNNNNNK